MTRLRNVDRYYVQAQQIDFPHGKKIVAGPFEERSESWAEYNRMRAAKEHPGCDLRPICKRVPIEEAHPK